MSSFTCPVDGTMLVPVERQGIEIDHCPTCRGVWLDRGELDKLIERGAAAAAPPPPAPPAFGDPYPERRHYDDHRRYPQKRKKSFLEELFD